VRLYPATDPKDVRFHLYDRRSGKRVRYERVIREEEPAAFVPDAAHDEPDYSAIDEGLDEPDGDDTLDEAGEEPEPAEPSRRAFEIPPGRVIQPWPGVRIEPEPEPDQRVSSADIVRGYALPSGDLVTVSDEELELIKPERSRTIEIEEFVELAEIDPVFFEKTYYVAPTRGTLFVGDEVRDASEVVRLPSEVPSERELKTAQQLIKALATEWVPEKHADAYREELMDLLRSKSPATPAEHEALPRGSAVDDLMAALKASVEEAKKRNASANGKQRALPAKTKRAR
jgi:DNA end-binding protein Ku